MLKQKAHRAKETRLCSFCWKSNQ